MDKFLDVIKAIIYGIVEGVTEWLPVSSTGHLILVEALLPFKNVSEGFFDMFDVVIQLGAILAVVILFWKKIWPFQLPAGQVDPEPGLMGYVKRDKIILWIKIMVACVPAAVIGVLFDDVFDALFYNPTCIALALIVFGVAFIAVENWNKGRKAKVRRLDEITYQTALIIGVFQLIAAIFPGTSRSGATIVGALLIGVSRTVAAEFTFFLAIPVMFGASLLKVLKFGFVCGVCFYRAFPDGLYQKAQFQSVWLVSNPSWGYCIAFWFPYTGLMAPEVQTESVICQELKIYNFFK